MNSNDTKLEAIKNSRDAVIDARAEYYGELVKFAVRLHREIEKETNEQIKEAKSIVIEETIAMMSTAWRNTIPFNLFVSKNADEFAKNLGVSDLSKHDYSLKFSMDNVMDQLEEPNFSTVSENLSEQELSKLNRAIKTEAKALNSNVMLHWEHAYTGKMFVTDATALINELGTTNATDEAISTAVKELVEKQCIVWLLKTENYVLSENGYKEIRKPTWEAAYKESGIELSDQSKADYKHAFGKEW